MAKAAFHFVARPDDLGEGESRCFEVAGERILLCRSGGGFFAVSPTCSHAAESLEGGRIRHGRIACPHHGARFELRSGRSLQPSAYGDIASYVLRVTDNSIEVLLRA